MLTDQLRCLVVVLDLLGFCADERADLPLRILIRKSCGPAKLPIGVPILNRLVAGSDESFRSFVRFWSSCCTFIVQLLFANISLYDIYANVISQSCTIFLLL